MAPLWRPGLVLGGLLLLLAWLGSHAPIAADSGLPWIIVAALAVAFGLGALAGAWHVGREGRSAARAYDAMTVAGQRMLSSGADYRIPLPPDPGMHPIVALLNSFADHRDAQVARAADRDAEAGRIVIVIHEGEMFRPRRGVHALDEGPESLPDR